MDPQTREVYNTAIKYELLLYVFAYAAYTIAYAIFIVANHYYLNDKFSFYFTISIYFGILLPLIVLNWYRSYSRHRAIYLSLTWHHRITPQNVELILRKKYKHQDNIEEIVQLKINEECSICLESSDDTDFVLLNCGHKFHTSCLANWLINKRNCPICRDSEVIQRTDFIDV